MRIFLFISLILCNCIKISGISLENNQIKYSFINAEKLPLVISPENVNPSLESFQAWLLEHRTELKQLVSEYGALLLRGFPTRDANDFAFVVRTILAEPITYRSGEGSRKKIADGVYTSTEAPIDYYIRLHNELSCTDSPISYICFYCAVEPAAGTGQTLLGRTQDVTQDMMNCPNVWNLFEGKTLKYISRHPSSGSIFNKINKTQRTWQEAFETDSKLEVETICREKGFEFKWTGDWLEVARRAPAIKEPDDHFAFPYWFNQSYLYHCNPRLYGKLNYLLANIVYAQPHTRQYDIAFDDGSLIPTEIMYHIYDILDQNIIKFDWQKQDVLLLDNFKTLHGKAPCFGQRKILVSMVQ